MRKDMQGKITVTFAIPELFEKDEELCEKYVRYITEQLAKTDILKDCEKAMLIGEIEKTEDGTPFFEDREYYEDYYDAIFPEDFE